METEGKLQLPFPEHMGSYASLVTTTLNRLAAENKFIYTLEKTDEPTKQRYWFNQTSGEVIKYTTTPGETKLSEKTRYHGADTDIIFRREHREKDVVMNREKEDMFRRKGFVDMGEIDSIQSSWRITLPSGNIYKIELEANVSVSNTDKKSCLMGFEYKKTDGYHADGAMWQNIDTVKTEIAGEVEMLRSEFALIFDKEKIEYQLGGSKMNLLR